MVSSREAVASLFGAWRLARLDPRGMSCFNATEEGFWHSFVAAVICAPAYAVVVALDYAHTPLMVSDARLVSVYAIGYVINWTAFPLAMSWATRLLDREQFYVRYVVALNWTKVLESMLFLPARALATTNVDWFTVLPGLTAFIVFGYQWYVARTALKISGSQAVAVVGLDLMFDIALMIAYTALLPAGPI
jgi:hypothetical protein